MIWSSVEELIRKLGNAGVTNLSNEYEDKVRFETLVNSTKSQIQGCFNSARDIVEELKGLSEINAVRILTIHKCKGLEFNTVIVQGVEEETFWGDADAAKCAYFVAISRAKEQLIVTTSSRREKPAEFTGFWKENRRPQSLFLSYVEPHIGGVLD